MTLSNKKGRILMAKKYYAVRSGRTPGIYETWADCQKQIHGFSGAVYKSFPTKEEADSFVKGGAETKKEPPKTEAAAYVDGSYDAKTKAFSYGMVLFHKGEELHFSEKFTDSSLAEMRNVAGEIKGSQAAMQYCLDHGIASITIYHDYEGIARWCNGEWAAKKPGTIAYAAFFKTLSQKVAVRFVKVKGHSGDTYNDMADQLAKEALGIG